MGFIELFFTDKKEIKETDIKLFISQKIEESINLDYKDVRAYQDADDLSIDISSFANSEGGLIILGVSQDEIKNGKGKIIKIYPKEITWGEVSWDKESLENRLVTRIKPPISGLVIKPVRNKKNKVIFLIDIPKSSNAPHMSPDNRYNKRLNFRNCPMEHYEVANLFRINWTLKERLVEKILVPLASVLEKHTKQLIDYECPYVHEIEQIMEQTYYKTQLPFELLDGIDYYVDQMAKLDRQEFHARRAMTKILNSNIPEYFKRNYSPPNDELRMDFKAITNTGTRIDLYNQIIFKILLKNQRIMDYLAKAHWMDICELISVTYSNETNTEKIEKFDDTVWSKCLKEVAKDNEILQMKKDAEILLNEAWELIGEIIDY